MKRMSIFGIGPLLAIFSTIYGTIIVLINYLYFSSLTFVLISPLFSLVLGTILVGLGLLAYLYSGYFLYRHFRQGKLCTMGMFAYVRNPLYASWIFLIVPGLVIIFGLLLTITIPFWMYLVFRLLIGKEEVYLRHKFEKEYLDYERKVGRVFPRLRL